MKIAHVCVFYSPAICGVKQVVEELATRQVKQGHEVHVYTSDWDKKQRIKIREEIINGVHIHRCRHILRVANFEVIFPSVLAKLLKGNFDIIHSHVFGHLHFVLAALAAKIKKTVHIHTTHCPWTDAHRSTVGRIGILLSYSVFSRVSLAYADKIIAITPWEINSIKKYRGREEQIVVIPNGMDNIFFGKRTKNDFKKRHNITGKLILFFGRLNITKGPDKFVEIAKLVLKERTDVTFVIRGPDEGMREEIRKLISDNAKIILLDETRDRNEIAEMYQAADIYVLPSFREGLPLTLFEAMAAGLPVVATPVNGIPYELLDGENGFLVQYGDITGFMQRIINILDNKKLHEKISKKNREKAKKHNWDNIYEATIDVYKKALEKKNL